MKRSAWLVIFAVVALILVYEFANGLGAGDTESDGDPSDAAPTNGLASSILDALAGFENVGPSHNNPGGLSHVGPDGTMVPNTYSSPDAGASAAVALILTKLAEFPTITVQQFVNLWQSGKLNPTDPQYAQTLLNYGQHVADALGIGVNDSIASAGDGGDGGPAGFDDDDSTEDNADDD